MSEGFQALTEREKQTLRLLLAGHDIKSVAVRLGLSVHTVNERLRDARRKLGASNSRQAARLLAEHEARGPEFSGDMQSGVAGKAARAQDREHSDRRRSGGQALAWLGGGMLMMSLIVTAAALSSWGRATLDPHAPEPARLVAASNAADAVGAASARDWVKLVDGQRWAESWSAAGTLFKSQVSEAAWAAKAQAVRQRLGPVTSSALKTVTRASSLPGAPDGDYEIIQFATSFEHKQGAVETVVLAHEAAGWKVDGYFIK